MCDECRNKQHPSCSRLCCSWTASLRSGDTLQTWRSYSPSSRASSQVILGRSSLVLPLCTTRRKGILATTRYQRHSTMA